MLRIITNNTGSEGLRNLREAFGDAITSMARANNRVHINPVMASSNPTAQIFSRTQGRLFLSWGSSQGIPVGDSPVINKPAAVGLATHKLRFFQRIDEWNAQSPDDEQVTTVPWTTDRNAVNNWLTDGPAYARTVLQGHSGEGIEVINRGEDITRAPLYTKGITGARREYRVHVIGGKIALVQLKKRRSGAGTATGDEDTIRNLGSGWVYAVSDANPSRLVLKQAINTVKALGLDFGAVDIIAKGRKGRENSCYVLEVNTAPGQRGDSTVKVYARAIAAVYADFTLNPELWTAETSSSRLEELPWEQPVALRDLLSQAGTPPDVITELAAEEVVEVDNQADEAPADEDDDNGAPAAPQPVEEAGVGFDIPPEVTQAVNVSAAQRAAQIRNAANTMMGFDRNGDVVTAATIRRQAPQAHGRQLNLDNPTDGLSSDEIFQLVSALANFGYVAPLVDRNMRGLPIDVKLRQIIPQHAVDAAIAATRTPPRRGNDVPNVELPARIAPASRLGNADPRNEQMVIFNFNERREVGVINTVRGAVYMAGSDMPIPVAHVELLAVVGPVPN